MHFPQPLVRAKLLKRYKRFLADVELPSGDVVVAHCANSGSMRGCAEPGMTVYLLPNDNPKAKLDWRWELVDVGSSLVGINTARPNAIVEEAILAGRIAEIGGYASLRREVKYGVNSRIDILLEGPDVDYPHLPPVCFVEVKNATMAVGNKALFPDAVTARGAKHLVELMGEVQKGNRAVMFFLVNRSDCDVLAPADAIDPVYGARLREAAASGVEILAYRTHLSDKEIHVAAPVRLDLS